MKKILTNYRVQTQLLDNWCWAAVTSSISLCFDRNSRWTQSRLASVLVDSSCINITDQQSPDAAICDQTEDLNQSLKLTKNWAPGVGRALSLQEIIRQIDNLWPICCQIKWKDLEGSHFVVIYGYNNDWLRIGDPQLGAGAIDIPYRQFLTDYRDNGNWVRSIGTTPVTKRLT